MEDLKQNLNKSGDELKKYISGLIYVDENYDLYWTLQKTIEKFYIKSCKKIKKKGTETIIGKKYNRR